MQVSEYLTTPLPVANQGAWGPRIPSGEQQQTSIVSPALSPLEACSTMQGCLRRDPMFQTHRAEQKPVLPQMWVGAADFPAGVHSASLPRDSPGTAESPQEATGQPLNATGSLSALPAAAGHWLPEPAPPLAPRVEVLPDLQEYKCCRPSSRAPHENKAQVFHTEGGPLTQQQTAC